MTFSAFLIITTAALWLNSRPFMDNRDPLLIAVVNGHGYLIPVAEIDSTSAFSKPWPEPESRQSPLRREDGPKSKVPFRWYFNPTGHKFGRIDTLFPKPSVLQEVLCQYNWMFPVDLINQESPIKSFSAVGIAFSSAQRLLSQEELKPWAKLIKRFRQENLLFSVQSSGEGTRHVINHAWFSHQSAIVGFFEVIGYESYEYIFVVIRGKSIATELKVFGGSC